MAGFCTREIKTKGAIHSMKKYGLNCQKISSDKWNSNFRNFKRALWGISTDRNFRKILSRNSVPVDFPPGIFRIFYFSEVQQFPPNIWRTFHSTKNSENCGTDKNGTKISWENFQKMRKLLNFQKANQSTNIPEIPAENQMEPNSW